jgi:ABC-type transport system substrate-binding protein
MFAKRLSLVLGLLVAISVVLSACAAGETPTAAPGEATEVPAAATAVPTEAPSTAPTEAAPPTGGTLRIGILSDIDTRNVWWMFAGAASAYNNAVMSLYYPTLYTQSVVRYDLITSVAADFATPLEQEGDFWVCTVPLQHGVLWSDGTELTAEDVAFTANTAVMFQLSGNWLYDYTFLDHTEAVDPYTVKFYYHTRPGLSTHEYGVLQSPIVQKAFWEPLAADAYAVAAELEGMDPESEEFAAKLAEAQELLFGLDGNGEPTAGPWLFHRWEVGAFVENNVDPQFYFRGAVVEEYADGAYREHKEGAYDFTVGGEAAGEMSLTFPFGPFFDSAVYSVYNQDAAVLALLDGEVDYIYNPVGYGPGLQAQLREDPGVATTTNPQNGFRFMGFNFNTPPLDDPAVRQAIDCMIDRDFLTQNLLQGAALPAYSAVPSVIGAWYNPDVRPFCDGMATEERLAWAVQHLKDAGYSWDVEPTMVEDRGGVMVVQWGEGLKMPDGSYVPELRLIAPSAGYDPLRATTGVFVEQWINQLGIPAKAELIAFNTIRAETIGGGGNFDMAITGWGLGDTFPDHLCEFFQTGKQFNFMGYSSPELDALCEQFSAATTVEEAQAIGMQLQVILAEDLPYIILWSIPIVDAYRSDTVQYPFTEVLDGLQGTYYGLQPIVNAAE